jgi:hypothetical protein
MPRDLPNPFEGEGAWLRCALHAHTTNSDGELEPAGLARHYARAGYDVLAITDHWRRTEAASKDGLLVIPSAELSCALADGRSGHVLAFGIEDDPDDLHGTEADLGETAAWIAEHRGVAYLAHPYWSGASAAEEALGAGVVGLEVYNAGCELEVGRGLSAVHWDETLGAGRLCFGIASDDSHHPGFDSDLAWIWARVAERAREPVLEALRSGAFYSTTGPLIRDVRVEDDAVEVVSSACRSVVLVCGPGVGASVTSGRLGYRFRAEAVEQTDDGAILVARLERPARSLYGRIEVVDLQGRKAWTNPLWI